MKNEEIKQITIGELIQLIHDDKNKPDTNESIEKELFHILYGTPIIQYPELIRLLPKLTIERISQILRYDRDYTLAFVLICSAFVEEEDMTIQAKYLMRRHGLEYIKPLLPYCDEDELREEYLRLNQKRAN